MSEPVVTISAAAEYNKAYMASMTTNHIKMTLNHIEEVEDESKEDNPSDMSH
jgi:hypothetical protein